MPVMVYDCPWCHAARMTHEMFGQGRNVIPNALWHVTMVCKGCNQSSLAHILPTKGGGIQPHGVANISEHFKTVTIVPAAVETAAPYGTPEAIAKRFVEAEKNFNDQRWNSAVGMLRSVLDIATKQLAPDGAKLTMAKRIDAMVASHKLPAAMGEWAHQVRIEGNDALHDPDEFAEADAAPLHRFAQMFLIYAYEMPQRVIDARATP